MTDEAPGECLDWQGKVWTPAMGKETGQAGGASEWAVYGSGESVSDDGFRLGVA